ncbi:hypothetical protein BH11BAC2_BH11BAC2_07930 [soil metagenome]
MHKGVISVLFFLNFELNNISIHSIRIIRKMKKVLLFILAALFSAGLSSAQQRKVIGNRNAVKQEKLISTRVCGTGTLPDEYEIWFQQKIVEFTSKQQANKSLGIATVYNLPVVVHVIYNNAAQNISTAQINSQIAVLNEDYRRLNADTTNTPGVFQGAAADCEINFCLAQTDPLGNATTGIDRISASAAGFTAPPYQQTYIDATIKPATIWNPNEYLNLWVVGDFYTGVNQLLGYATFPAGSTLSGLTGNYGTLTSDGVVCWYRSFGRVGTLDPFYNKGRTATHEIGHWLGLRHIWGDANCGNDYCTDTPTQQTANGNCPTFPSVTCTNGPNGDMFMNYMDYPPDACLNVFTNNQKTRMQTAMANSPFRVALSASTKCSSPVPTAPVAGFTANATSIPVGGTVNFTDLSSNTPTSWAWTFAGGSPSSSTIQNPSGIVYSTAGTYTVTLVATNGIGSDTETKTGYINVTSGGGSCDTLSNFDFAAYTPNIYTSTVGYVSGQNNYGDISKADKFTITGVNKAVTGVLIYFGIGTSSGTGQTADVTVWDDNGTGGLPNTVLGTQPISYDSIVVSATNLTPVYVSFPSGVPVSGNVYVGVQFTYNAGDTLAILTSTDGDIAVGAGTAYEQFNTLDWHPFSEVNISWGLELCHVILPIVCTITGIDQNNELSKLAVYPNPTRDILNIVIPEQKSRGDVNFRILNVTGSEVLKNTSQSTQGGMYKLDVSHLNTGFYFLEISTSEGRRLEKFQINR